MKQYSYYKPKGTVHILYNMRLYTHLPINGIGGSRYMGGRPLLTKRGRPPQTRGRAAI